MPKFLQALLKRYGQDSISERAAALSYFTIFSIGPLLFVLLGVIGVVLNSQHYRERLLSQLQDLIGPQAGDLVNNVVNSQQLSHAEVWSFVIGGVGLVLGAAGIFGQLQKSLNEIMHIKANTPGGITGFLKVKLTGLALIGLIAFMIMVTLVASAFIGLVASHFSNQAIAGTLFTLLDFAISLVIFTALLAIMYRTLLYMKVQMKLVFAASFFVALAFSVGKILLGIIIGRNGSVTAFGAAGALISLLLWIFYSGQIVYLGAAGISMVVDKNPNLAQAKYPGSTYKIIRLEKPVDPGLKTQLITKFKAGIKKGWLKNG